MKKFNINYYMYIQITDYGFEYLKKTVGEDYILHCINSEHYKKVIEGEVWYKLQTHEVFSLFDPNPASPPCYELNVMFDEKDLKDV